MAPKPLDLKRIRSQFSEKKAKEKRMVYKTEAKGCLVLTYLKENFLELLLSKNRKKICHRNLNFDRVIPLFIG